MHDWRTYIIPSFTHSESGSEPNESNTSQVCAPQSHRKYAAFIASRAVRCLSVRYLYPVAQQLHNKAPVWPGFLKRGASSRYVPFIRKLWSTPACYIFACVLLLLQLFLLPLTTAFYVFLRFQTFLLTTVGQKQQKVTHTGHGVAKGEHPSNQNPTLAFVSRQKLAFALHYYIFT